MPNLNFFVRYYADLSIIKIRYEHRDLYFVLKCNTYLQLIAGDSTQFSTMKDLIYQFITQQKLAVVSTINSHCKPESALVGIAVSINLEIIFDTVTASRKYQNILHNPNVSVVVGWDDEITVQYEGYATVLGKDSDADNMREIYYRAYPDGRERADTWPGLVHIKISPKWIRYNNFNEPTAIKEFTF